jgi:hypothetical protein
MPLINPLAGTNGTWLRGSFHGHCNEHSACASVPLADSLRQYEQVGAGFYTLTDHDHVTDLGAARDQYPQLSMLHGFEYSTRENVVFCGPEVTDLYRESLEDALLHAGDLLTIVCHPQPMGAAREYWTRRKLEALGTMPDGIEVYNYSPLDIMSWDSVTTTSTIQRISRMPGTWSMSTTPLLPEWSQRQRRVAATRRRAYCSKVSSSTQIT